MGLIEIEREPALGEKPGDWQKDGQRKWKGHRIALKRAKQVTEGGKKLK